MIKNNIPKIAVSIFLIFNQINCQEKEKVQYKASHIEEENNSMMEKVLKNQLQQGANNYINDAGVEIPKDKFTDEDLDVLTLLAENILKSNGYKFPNQQEFNQNIYLKLNRIIDNKSNSKYLYVNFFDRCDRRFNYYPYNGIDYNGLYIIKERGFISKFYFVPELINYQQEYPEISKVENSVPLHYSKDGENYSVELWKELEERNDDYSLKKQRHFNQQLLINRNKYLFNDSKASLAWLKFNDQYFLESLVTTFGYTKDKDLLDWVMQRNRSKAVEFINNYVFVRNCKGELEIREDILKYIEQKTTDEENTHDYAKALYHYEVYENPNKWTEKEAYKILAYKSNTYDYLFMKYKNIRYNNRWNILGSIFYYSNRGDEKEWKEIEKNFEKNNYYNLPHLKEALEYAYIFE